MLGIDQETGFNAVPVSLSNRLLDQLPRFGTSYLLLGLAVPAALVAMFSSDRRHRFLLLLRLPHPQSPPLVLIRRSQSLNHFFERAHPVEQPVQPPRFLVRDVSEQGLPLGWGRGTATERAVVDPEIRLGFRAGLPGARTGEFKLVFAHRGVETDGQVQVICGALQEPAATWLARD